MRIPYSFNKCLLKCLCRRVLVARVVAVNKPIGLFRQRSQRNSLRKVTAEEGLEGEEHCVKDVRGSGLRPHTPQCAGQVTE